MPAFLQFVVDSIRVVLKARPAYYLWLAFLVVLVAIGADAYVGQYRHGLIETGMRRGAIPKLDVEQVDVRRKTLTVGEKGGYTHTYQISQEGLRAIQDYLAHERPLDAEHWHSPALFLPALTMAQSRGRLRIDSFI